MNKTAPDSQKCNFQVQLTVLAKLDKNPEELPPDFRKKALFLVAIETTNDHDWKLKAPEQRAPGSNFEFGPHGALSISDFGNHDKTDIDAYYTLHKDEFSTLTVKDMPNMVTDEKKVSPEIKRMA